MDASSSIVKSSKEDPIMYSDVSKTSTEDYDSSGDESSTERGYRRCIQKYSKYLPGGELVTQQTLRNKRDNELDDITSKDGDDSGGAMEKYKQFLTKNYRGTPDEGDYQPIEIIIKSQSAETEDMLLETDEDFHRWVSPDVSTSKDKAPKQTSNVLASEDLNVVNILLGAESDDSDDENAMMRPNGKSRENIPRADNRKDGKGNDIENQIDNKEATKSTSGGDMETGNIMLLSSVSSDDEVLFQAAYPDLQPIKDDDTEKNSALKSTNLRMYDDEIEESHRFPQMDEVDDNKASETRPFGNTAVGNIGDPSDYEESLHGSSGRNDRGAMTNTNSDSGESSIMTSDSTSSNPMQHAEKGSPMNLYSDSDEPTPPVPIRKQNINGVQQEELTPIEEGATFRSSTDFHQEDSVPQVVDPWIQMMESRDMRIDHMDTDFLCLLSKPSLKTMNNVIGNTSLPEDETIQCQRNVSSPVTPELLLSSNDENTLESKFLAVGRQINAPELKLQTRHIQGAERDRQGSPPDIKSNTREIMPHDGSLSDNDNDRSFDSKYQISDPRHVSQHLNSLGRSKDFGVKYGQGSHSTNETSEVRDSNQSATSSRVDQSTTDVTQSVVSSNGWESTTSSSLGGPYQDLENAGIESDDDGPPHLFSDSQVSSNDEFDSLTAGQEGGRRAHNSEISVDKGPQPRSSEITVVSGSRSQNKDSDALVRERHGIATGRSENSAGRPRVPLATPERRNRKAKIFGICFFSFMIGGATFYYIWQTYLVDDTEVQAAQGPSSDAPTVTETPSRSPSWSPSIVQTRSPSEALRDLVVSAWPSLESNLADSSSPQSKALLWLQNNSKIDSYDSQQRIQRFALAAFFYSTNGAMWINKGSWLTDADECEWNLSNSFRPPCNEEGLYVYLELNSNGVSGVIPSELALLSNSLVRLELSQNGSGASVISGSIPPELGKLTLLEVLNLANNELSGELPNEIGEWTKATAIDISGNALVSRVPPTIAALTSLRSLNLQRNSLTLLPRQIGDLVSLRSLDVSYNRLGNIPAEIGGLVSLRTLDISHNQIRSSIPSEIGLLSLRNLDTSHNQIQSSIPSEIGRQSGLVSLDLSNNRLSGSIPIDLSRVTLLRNLALHNNGLIGTIPASFGALSRLATFRVEANDLTGIVSQNICNVFNESVPAFVSDCVVELDCPCCMFCCEDPGACQCQLEGELEFLCDEYTTTFKISSLGFNK